ncbi:MAG TPA: hypothetical protein VNZ64_05280 [Candidatus Acidoferrum sp.]|nr:hypothetical protein [Candidatus Acidoferrum sp.]
MNELLEKAIFTGFGGVIAATVGLAISEIRRKRDALIEFKITLSELYGESISVKDLLSFHKGTLERLRQAVFRVRPFVSKEQAGLMEKLWLRYQQIDADALNPEHESDWVQELYQLCGEAAPVRPSRIISLYLKKFSDLGH